LKVNQIAAVGEECIGSNTAFRQQHFQKHLKMRI
jgi:hypothetical protein